MPSRMRLLALLPFAVACYSKPATTTDTAKGTVATTTAPAVDAAAAKTAIEAQNSRAVEAFMKGDLAPMLANYADDAIVMMQDTPAWRGRAAIESAMKGMMGEMKFADMKFNTEDVKVGGDLAVETGTFSWTVTPKGGKPMAQTGKYVTVWQHQADGSWKSIRDINNMDAPAK